MNTNDLIAVLNWIYDHEQLAKDFEARFPDLACAFASGTNMDATSLEIPLKDTGLGEYLRVDKSMDPDYPGVDIELSSKVVEDMDIPVTYPRVCIEQNKGSGQVRVLIWENPLSEDYTREIPLSDLFTRAIMEKAKSEQGKAPEKAPQSPLHGPAREALIDEQLEQMNRTEAVKKAKAEGNLNAFVMASKAYFYVEYENRFQKNPYLAGYAVGCYEVYSLLFAIFGRKRKMSGDALTKFLKENVEITRKDAFSDMPKNDYTTGVLTGRFKAWESAYEVVSKENKEVLNANQTDDKEIPPEWFGRS